MPGESTCSFFFFNDTATTEIYTLSLHDALPISVFTVVDLSDQSDVSVVKFSLSSLCRLRSEEHTSELQSHSDLVCRLLLEKKKPILHKPHPRQLLKFPPNRYDGEVFPIPVCSSV